MATIADRWTQARYAVRRAARSAATAARATGVLATIAAASVVVHAQAPQAPQGFTVGGNVVHENLPATPFVFAAYAIVWGALLVYVFMLWRRAGRLAQEIERVQAQLASRR